ncbi:MAG: alanine/glycine:cation symporter family protein [Cyanobacteriota bacterium]
MKQRKIAWLTLALLLTLPGTVLAAEEASSLGFLDRMDAVFGAIVAGLEKTLFLEIGGIPLIVLWLVIAAIFFTIQMRFVNIRAFKHAIDVVRGRYDDPNEPGEVSHFQALAAALSATVGLGNIAGVAIAIQVGGPGAVFWMTLAGLFGMTSKFVECTLGQMYRIVRQDGTVSGGPMHYLSKGLAERGLRSLGKVLAGVFAIFCIGGSIGGGNMFQANQAFAAVAQVVPWLQDRSWVFGLILAVLVGLVIIGGIQRIGVVAGALVPTMCFIYVLSALWILLVNFTEIPRAIGVIITEAFVPQAIQGGFIGVFVQGVRRSVFSNEAGIGSASIAHSAARTNEPVREGIVALLEPFIDTVIICNMTALVVVITGVYQNTGEGLDGVRLTANAFSSVIGWFPILLSLSVFLFAFSTIISWSYYGERAWAYLFGEKTQIVFKVLYVIFVFIGVVVSLRTVVAFGDIMLLSMAFPNLLGCYILSTKVKAALDDYLDRLNNGEMLNYEES